MGECFLVKKGGVSGGDEIPDFSYTGSFRVIDDGEAGWRFMLLTSGVFTPLKTVNADVFLVGGGGGGRPSQAGGGGGYTRTESTVLNAKTAYSITIGAGSSYNGNATSRGGTTSAFGFSALGGFNGNLSGGNGGSAGGNGGGDSSGTGGKAGSDGSNSQEGGHGSYAKGIGQGTTTREFGEPDGQLYAGGGAGYGQKNPHWRLGDGGGGGYSADNPNYTGMPNTGGGGAAGSAGGSGIVVIRNAR